MGRVYLAKDSRLKRMVALKALSPDLMSSPSYRERFEREANAAAALTHPGICTIHALEEFDGELFIVSEFSMVTRFAKRFVVPALRQARSSVWRRSWRRPSPTRTKKASLTAI